MVTLTDKEFAALWELAQRERRDFRDQAALLVHKALTELGAVKDEG